MTLGACVTSGQEEVNVRARAYGRAKLNRVVVYGPWAWFTEAGALYRKHQGCDSAELIYGAVQFPSAKVQYMGLLLSSERLVYKQLLTTENSGLPVGYLTIRFDWQGLLWLSDRNGTEVSYNGAEWSYHTVRVVSKYPRRQMDPELWSANTPFSGSSVSDCKNTDCHVPDSLVHSIVPTSSFLSERHWPFSAVDNFDVHPNGSVYAITKGGLYIFRLRD